MINMQELHQHLASCRAWEQFWSPRTIRAFRRLRASTIWFQPYEAFAKWIAEFDCDEKSLRRTIGRLMLPTDEPRDYEFRRNQFNDTRAWVRLPIGWFVPFEKGFREPVLQLSLRKPWEVSEDCFAVHRCVRKGRKVAEMLFRHPELDQWFSRDGKQAGEWCAEIFVDPGQSPEQIRQILMRRVYEQAPKVMVTIVEA